MCALRTERWRAARTRPAGFSLIELMIVVTIVGILAAIAYPSYRAYVLKSNRTDAVRVLTNDAQILQRCYSQTFKFNDASCPTLPTTSPNGYYTMTNTIDVATYSLTAAATGGQAADTTCASLSLDQTGKQSALNSGDTDESTTCWGRN